MNRFKRSQIIVKASITIGVLGGIVLGIFSENEQLKDPKTVVESMITWMAFVVVIGAVVLYWIVPNTQWGKTKLYLSESRYVFFFYVGLVVGTLGLVTTLFQSELVIQSHLFELLLALFGLNYIFWAMILKREKSVDVSTVLDEKQIDNIIKSAATTLMLSSFIMFMLYFGSYHNLFVLDGKVWFLVYVFSSMIIFSIGNIVFFQMA